MEARQVEMVYCANGNRKFAEIAMNAGFTYGAQLPGTTYFCPEFVDQNWKKPERQKYMDAVRKYRPRICTVLDLEREEQLDEVWSWAEGVACYAQTVVIIPKVFGIIPRLPRRIGGADVRLGYSVPTKFGGTELPVWEFAGWPVHLLGGSPNAQMELAHYLDVRSADGNMAMKAATKFCNYWDGIWRDIDVTGYAGNDAPYEAFRRSCENIAAAWEKLHKSTDSLHR